MEAVQQNETFLVTKEGFRAIGLKWEGTFAEAGAGGIRVVHTELQDRLGDIPQAVHPETLLGLSYHVSADGFTHYAVVEVAPGAGAVPEGMVSISVPTLTYAKCEHKKGQSIDASYRNIYTWIESRGYEVHEGELTHFEEYPMSQNPYSDDPEFVIMIPVASKREGL